MIWSCYRDGGIGNANASVSVSVTGNVSGDVSRSFCSADAIYLQTFPFWWHRVCQSAVHRSVLHSQPEWPEVEAVQGLQPVSAVEVVEEAGDDGPTYSSRMAVVVGLGVTRLMVVGVVERVRRFVIYFVSRSVIAPRVRAVLRARRLFR